MSFTFHPPEKIGEIVQERGKHSRLGERERRFVFISFPSINLSLDIERSSSCDSFAHSWYFPLVTQVIQGLFPDLHIFPNFLHGPHAVCLPPPPDPRVSVAWIPPIPLALGGGTEKARSIASEGLKDGFKEVNEDVLDLGRWNMILKGTA